MRLEIKVPSKYETLGTTLVMDREGLEAEAVAIIKDGKIPAITFPYNDGVRSDIAGLGKVRHYRYYRLAPKISTSDFSTYCGYNQYGLLLVALEVGSSVFKEDNAYGKKGEKCELVSKGGVVPDDVFEALEIKMTDISVVEEKATAIAPLTLLNPPAFGTYN